MFSNFSRSQKLIISPKGPVYYPPLQLSFFWFDSENSQAVAEIKTGILP